VKGESPKHPGKPLWQTTVRRNKQVTTLAVEVQFQEIRPQFRGILLLNDGSLDTMNSKGETLSHNRNRSNPKNGTTHVTTQQEDFEEWQ
jgi:hypothetical protein